MNTCTISIPLLGCIDKTDALVVFAAVAFAFFVLVVVPLWMQSRKADKVAERLERSRKHRENPTNK